VARHAIFAAAALLTLLSGVRLWFVDGLLRPVTIDGPSMAPAFCGAHFDVTCSQCGVQFACDAEHLPASSLAECFNCGFDRISLEGLPAQPPDSVLIDRWPLLFRAPKRHEVVACLNPDGIFTVKRVAALPGEHLRIVDGQLYNGSRVIQKTYAEAQQMQILAHVEKDDSSGFESSDRITDYDAYNQGEIRRPLNEVRDVWLECVLQVLGSGTITLTALDGDDRVEWLLEPARQISLRKGKQTLLTRQLIDTFRRPTRLEFGSCDGQVFLAIDGRTVFLWTNPTSEPLAPAQSKRMFAINGNGLEVRIGARRTWRDIYYLDPDGLSRTWQLPHALADDEYAVLGDNQPVSVDSRQWEQPGVKRQNILGVVYRPFWARRR
jgi:type IV secretory pathway protease TraF